MRILSATDLLPKSDAAFKRAGFLASLLEAELGIVHAVPPDAPDGQTPEERVRCAGSRLVTRTSPPQWRWKSPPDLTVQFGHPARVVLDNAHRQNARLLVLGPHRQSPFADAVHGTTMEKVLGAATCPLLIARQDMQGAYHQVLIALDASPHAAEVLRAAESLSPACEGLVTVIHAHEPPYAGMMDIVGVGPDATAAYVNASRQQAASALRELLDTHSTDASRYRISLIERRPTTALLESIDLLKPDLVVLGTRGHGRFRRALLGSVANSVLRETRCDVLLVPERATLAS